MQNDKSITIHCPWQLIVSLKKTFVCSIVPPNKTEVCLATEETSSFHIFCLENFPFLNFILHLPLSVAQYQEK